MMKTNLPAQKLNVAEFARRGETLEGELCLQEMPRLANLCVEPLPEGITSQTPIAHWHVQGELKTALSGQSQVWLHLHIEAQVPLRCQRCLKASIEPINVDLSYRFVATEEQAAAEDSQSVEEVLVSTRALDLIALCEDELIMALPLVALHEICPDPLIPGLNRADITLEVGPTDEELQADDTSGGKPNPFAALEVLLKKPH